MTSIVTLYFLNFVMLILYKPSTSQNATARIVGGLPAEPSEFPFVVFLHTRAKKTPEKYGQVRCTGTIITDQWVISGAHCFRLYPDLDSIVTNITAGTVDHFADPPHVQVRTSVRFVMHPLDKNVERKREFYNQDVILIKVNKRFSFDGHVNAVRLARSPFPYKRRVGCTMVGFGWLDPDNIRFNTRLFYTRTNIQGSCRQKQYQTGVWTAANLCMKPVQSVPCHGDSGGPLVCEGVMVGTFCGMWNLGWNIPNEEPPCNLKDNFFIYTFLGYFERWIRLSVPELPETKRLAERKRRRSMSGESPVSRSRSTRALFLSIELVLVGVTLVHCTL